MTWHVDLSVACAIAWQMRAFATRSYGAADHSGSNQGQQSQDFDY